MFRTNNNDFIQINELTELYVVYSATGENITELLNMDDNQYFRSDSSKVKELMQNPVKDFIIVSTNTSPDKDKIKMLIKYRNTLLSTTLLYDVVIGSQGIDALQWTKKMNEDRPYAMQFKSVYDMFSGISIEYYVENNRAEAGKFEDAGPINWKYSVAEIPVDKDGKVRIKLKFIPDNFMIDYIASDNTDVIDSVIINKLNPIRITDCNNLNRDDIADFIQSDDEQYLITNPGDCYRLQYNFRKLPGEEITLFIDSKGYYN